MRGRKSTLTIALALPDRRELQRWQRLTTISGGLSRRGRIVLLRADGMDICSIAKQVGISRRHCYKWLHRFLADGLLGLADLPGRGWHARLVEEDDDG